LKKLADALDRHSRERGIQIFRMLLDPRFRGGDDGDQFFNGRLSAAQAKSREESSIIVTG